MKIAFNSKEPKAACTIFYKEALSLMKELSFDVNFSELADFDVALFMTYQKDLEMLKETKLKLPHLKTAIIDPRGYHVAEYLDYCDFLIVDSIEMKDYWAFSEKEIFEYAEYPAIETYKRRHLPKDKLIIGYHGNKVHLHSMLNNVTPALERLADEYNIEFHAMYNISSLGEWKYKLPRAVKVRHIQWSPENYYECLSKCDIGIVPNLMPIAEESEIKSKSELIETAFPGSLFNYSKDDYLLRFKMPSNAGRIIIWALLGVPVVSDFYPSALQCIDDEENGFLACSKDGWYRALKRLASDTSLRQKFSSALQQKSIDKTKL